MNRAQRVAVLVAIVLAVVGLVGGLSSVSAETSIDGSYDCGTALGELFGDSERDWRVDSFAAALTADSNRTLIDVGGLPDQECPGAMSGRRTVTIGAFVLAAVVAIGGVALLKD